MSVSSEFGRFVWGPAQLSRSMTGNGDLFQLDDANDGVGAAFVCPRSGTITHIGWTMASKGETPNNYYAGLVVPSTTVQQLTATAYGGSAPGTFDGNALAVGFHWTALATNGTAVAGDHIGIAIWPTGSPGAPDTTNKIGVGYTNTPSSANNAPLAFGGNAPAMAAVTRLPAFAVKFSDGEVYGWPLLDAAYTAYDTADSPDEVGVKFTVPYAMRCIGMVVNLTSVEANAPYTVILYSAADAVLASWAVTDAGEMNEEGQIEFCWSSAVALSADTVYRSTILAMHGSYTVLPASGTWPDAATKTAYHQGAAFIATSRTDAGAWTDNTDATVFMSPIVDQVTLPDAGGSTGGTFAFIG